MKFSAILHTKYKVVTQHDDDDEIGTGKHALMTDKSGKFWGSAGAGGVFYSTTTKKFLLAYRSAEVNEPHTWGVWGGAIDDDETPLEAIKREIEEETGYEGKYKLIPSYVYKKGDFQYHNYIIEVGKEFKPKLCWETEKFGWFALDEFPTPLHFGLKALLPYLKKQEVQSASDKLIATSGIKNRWQKYAEENGKNIDLAEYFNFNDYLWSFDPNYPLSKFLPETLEGSKELYLKDKKTYEDRGRGDPQYTDQWEKEVISKKTPVAVLVEFRNKVYDMDDGGGILDGNHRLGLFAALKMKTIPAVVGRPKNPALFYEEWILPWRSERDKKVAKTPQG